MTREIAFVGDVHGNLDALQGLWSALSTLQISHAVFLGDYVNKGDRSREVLEYLGGLVETGTVTLLRGNHDAEMLLAVESGNLTSFLKMGGAVTVRSYVGGPVGADVWAEFARAVPAKHLILLRSMSTEYEIPGLIARHEPWKELKKEFLVSAHRQVGSVPSITQSSAYLDTGCGDRSGRLTAFLWPSRDYVQVDSRGELVKGLV